MIRYELIRSDRKTIAIQIKGDGRIIVRAPHRVPKEVIQQFVDAKARWIGKHLERISKREDMRPTPEKTLQELAAAALQDIPGRVAKYAAAMGVDYGRITIRAQKTRWGSCSARGNLNFNCLLMLCPEAVRDYVVIHELCHRKELNHSARFWHEVETIMPDYAVHRRWLKEHGSWLIRQAEDEK